MAALDGWLDYTSGLRDGEVALELNFDPGGSTMLALFADYNSDAAQHCGGGG